MANTLLSITNSKGRQVSLLNEIETSHQPKRRYHCTELGCQKSFTTSGHLARHHRIHTGEKNFHCIYPGCPSKFSRQDNMMQHYRTHMSSRSRHHQYLNHHRPHHHHHQRQILHCHSYYSSEGNELYSLHQQDRRGWSFSSASSSSTVSSSPTFHITSDYNPISHHPSPQNWSPTYSPPPSYYYYNDPV
ncbi:hypothetical protein HPULCUR_005314 [Helicostylum pulchrum]|uniref:C2H2-type domain-containing protein n=1 Tax=Helicostylum pulchrum TaxID=562976 RepID=A0ABP9XZK8_9FUNG